MNITYVMFIGATIEFCLIIPLAGTIVPLYIMSLIIYMICGWIYRVRVFVRWRYGYYVEFGASNFFVLNFITLIIFISNHNNFRKSR